MTQKKKKRAAFTNRPPHGTLADQRAIRPQDPQQMVDGLLVHHQAGQPPRRQRFNVGSRPYLQHIARTTGHSQRDANDAISRSSPLQNATALRRAPGSCIGLGSPQHLGREEGRQRGQRGQRPAQHSGETGLKAAHRGSEGSSVAQDRGGTARGAQLDQTHVEPSGGKVKVGIRGVAQATETEAEVRERGGRQTFLEEEGPQREHERGHLALARGGNNKGNQTRLVEQRERREGTDAAAVGQGEQSLPRVSGHLSRCARLAGIHHQTLHSAEFAK